VIVSVSRVLIKSKIDSKKPHLLAHWVTNEILTGYMDADGRGTARSTVYHDYGTPVFLFQVHG
jgi:hypothetical protein